MFVEQQVQLHERRARDLPMMLLVEVAQRDRVGQYLVQVLDRFLTHGFGKRDRHANQVPKRLDLVSLLAIERCDTGHDGVSIERFHDGSSVNECPGGTMIVMNAAAAPPGRQSS